MTNEPGLYVHVPFCSGKCPYCDFYSLSAPSLIPKWLEGVTKEPDFYIDDFKSFDTLYLGGGTPSSLSADVLSRLLESLHTSFTIKTGSEITIEANPEDVNHEWATSISSLGINRVSLGVQSFNDEELLFLGRRHTSKDCVRAIELLREKGGSTISIDLMYSLPGQKESDWLDNLNKALQFEPEHMSCYQLTIEPGTKFNRMLGEGAFSLPDENDAQSFFIKTSEFLEENGYVHYEVSNFSRGMKNTSKHNTKYWDRTPYLGLGPSAHSYLDSKRWWNQRSVGKYREAILKGQRPVEDHEILTPGQTNLEEIYLGLRTHRGISAELVLEQEHGREKLEKAVEAGLAVIKDGRIILTKKGLALADGMAIELSD